MIFSCWFLLPLSAQVTVLWELSLKWAVMCWTCRKTFFADTFLFSDGICDLLLLQFFNNQCRVNKAASYKAKTRHSKANILGFMVRTFALIANILCELKLWLSFCMFLFCYHFYTRKQLLLSVCLSHCNSACSSVHLFVTWVDQSKMVQDRITKSLSLAAWKTLVSGTVKLFQKFEGGHPEQGR